RAFPPRVLYLRRRRVGDGIRRAPAQPGRGRRRRRHEPRRGQDPDPRAARVAWIWPMSGPGIFPRTSHGIALVSLGILVLSARALAVPPQLTVQGVLRDDSGKLQSSTASVTIALFDAISGGNK